MVQETKAGSSEGNDTSRDRLAVESGHQEIKSNANLKWGTNMNKHPRQVIENYRAGQ